MNFSRLTLNLLRATAFSGILAAYPSVAEVFFENGYPTADTMLGEVLQENEKQSADELLGVIQRKIGADYFPGTAKRDEHTKSHGCVKAVFTVEPNIPEDLRQGLFAQPGSYQSMVRFSNSAPDSQAPDIDKDGRGFALKLYGVPGERLSPDAVAPAEQDFILLSVPYFFINSAKDYAHVIDVKYNGTKLQELELVETIGLQGTKNISDFFSAQIGNPLEQRYYSAVPYRLGMGDDRSRRNTRSSNAPPPRRPFLTTPTGTTCATPLPPSWRRGTAVLSSWYKRRWATRCQSKTRLTNGARTSLPL